MRILLFFIFLLFTLPSYAQTSCEEAEKNYTPLKERYQTGIIFRVEKCGLESSYIMGTMHLDDPAIYPIYEDALEVMGKVEKVGFEFIEDENTSKIAAEAMLYPPSEKKGLKSRIDTASFEMLAQEIFNRNQMPTMAVDRLKPWAASVMLQYPKPKSDGIALDKRLQDEAIKQSKILFGLETPQEQYAIFTTLTEEKQLVMLKDSIATIKESDALNDQFVRAYVARDLTTMQTLAEESFNMNSDLELRDYMKEHLLRLRNHVMAERLHPQLMAGSSLTGVGALHLMGDEGVLPLLEKQGYRIYPEK